MAICWQAPFLGGRPRFSAAAPELWARRFPAAESDGEIGGQGGPVLSPGKEPGELALRVGFLNGENVEARAAGLEVSHHNLVAKQRNSLLRRAGRPLSAIKAQCAQETEVAGNEMRRRVTCVLGNRCWPW